MKDFGEMEIIFNHLDIAYSLLANPEKIESEDSEELEDYPDRGSFRELEDIYSDYTTESFNFPPIVLPNPLNRGILVFRRNNEFYSSHFCLESKDSSVFFDASGRLAKKIKNWSPTNKDGCGYILNENKEPYISMVNSDKDKARLICLGSFGAIERKFEDFNEFFSALKNLENIVNIVVDSCLSPLVKSKQIPSLPEYSIYVNS